MGLQQIVDSLHSRGDTQWGVMQIDFRNAFNTLSRAQILDAVRKRCPEAVAWMETCYANHSRLYCQGRVLNSQRGLQQGDPCGPAGFAWGIHHICEGLENMVEWQAYYLDEATLVGTPSQLEAALQFIGTQAALIGVHVNLDKCTL